MSTLEHLKQLNQLKKETEENISYYEELDGEKFTIPTDTFADRLRLQMRIKHISARQLSKEAGLRWPTLRNWLQGKAIPNKANRKILIDYFGCDEWDL